MSRNTTNTNENGGVDQFIKLIDCPSSYSNPGDFVVINSTQDGLTFETSAPVGATKLTELTDCPNFISANDKAVLTANPTLNNTIWRQPAFTALSDAPLTLTPNNMIVVNPAGTALINQVQPAPGVSTFLALTDTPASYSGASTNIVTVNVTETGLTFTPQASIIPTSITQLTDGPDFLVANDWLAVNGSGTSLQCVPPPPQTFLQLADTPATYSGHSDQFVKVKVDETGLRFVAGGSDSSSLINLTDNTAGAYTVSNTNECVAINPNANGFQYTNMAYLQGGHPRLVQGMIKGYRNYPGTPGSQGFIYNQTDGELGEYFFFGCNRTNYNETRYLNDFWTTENTSGGSNFYPITGSDTTLDLSPKYVGIGGTAHSCGVNLKVNNTINIVAPFANNWYFDVLVDVSWRISLGNVDDNLYCMWICSKAQMDHFVNFNTDFDLVRKADYFWINETSGSYPANISEGHISKVVTMQCGSGSTVPDINVFMSVRRKEDYTIKNSFTINSYYYINCSYTILAMRAPVTGVDNPSLTTTLPGLFWT